jgi:hypothetical protein
LTTLLTQQILKERLSYDPQTGKFLWIKPTVSNIKAGATAGGVNKGHGYHVIRLYGKLYLAHRLAWFYMTGEWPIELDHINRIKHDNRWDNLRKATRSQNASHIRRVKKRNLPQGVYKNYNSFKAMAFVNKIKYYLGTYKTPEEAYKVYVEFKRKHCGSFSPF